MQYMKSAITNQELIGGVKKDIRMVTFSEADQSPEEPNISVSNSDVGTPTPPTSTNPGTLENQMSKLEEVQKEHTKLLKEIMRCLKDPDRGARNRSPTKEYQTYLNMVVNVYIIIAKYVCSYHLARRFENCWSAARTIDHK